jgi:Mg-chelatase subunit ChlD
MKNSEISRKQKNKSPSRLPSLNRVYSSNRLSSSNKMYSSSRLSSSNRIYSSSRLLVLLLTVLIFVLSSTAQTVYTTYINLNDTFQSVTLNFTEQVETHEFYVTLPWSDITSATINFTGIATVSATTRSADAILVTDVSGSMNTNSKIVYAKQADHDFVNTVNTSNIRVGLVKYDSCSDPFRDVLPLTRDKVLLNNTISSYIAENYTNICQGLHNAVMELNKSPSDNMHIILMTDGQANRYIDLTTGRCYSNSDTTRARACARAVARIANSTGIIVHTVAFGSDADTALLRDIASITGGEAHDASSGEDLIELYKKIAQDITQTSYVTPNVSEGLWATDQAFVGNAVWTDEDCGSSTVTCVNFRDYLQAQIDACPTMECRVYFSVSSLTEGQLIVSNLSIKTIPKGAITCTGNPLRYLMQSGTRITIPTDHVFVQTGEFGVINGTQITMPANSGVAISVASDYSEIYAESASPLGGEVVVWINLTTNQGYVSEGCPIIFTSDASQFGSITCRNAQAPRYILGTSQRSIPFNAIFTFDNNNPIGEFSSFSTNPSVPRNIQISHNFQTSEITALRTSNGFSETVGVQLRTNLGVVSPECPIEFTSIESQCSRQECQDYLQDDDIEGFLSRGCNDDGITVFNPTPVDLDVFYPQLRDVQYTVNSFTSGINPPFGAFEISPSFGGKDMIYNIYGTDVLHNGMGVGVIKLQLGNSLQENIFCPLLTKSVYDSLPAIDPTSELLVTGSKAIIGYYDRSGTIRTRGPYIFTAKVWLRK